MPTTSIGEWIRGVRAKKAQTQTEAAEAIGVHKMTIAKWETGCQGVGVSSALALARWAGVDVETVIGLGRG